MDESLYRTSLHEAGHLIVGEVLGKRGTLYLWRGFPTVGTAWNGRVQFADPPNDWSADDRIAVALAGTVSEEVTYARDGMNAEKMFLEAHNQLRTRATAFLSDCDLALAEGFEPRHVQRTYDIVTTRAEAIKQAAENARARALATLGGCGTSPT